MGFPPSMEIRKLPLSSISELTRILEPGGSWKNLMKIIPKTLSSTSYQCDITPTNLPKYRTEHFTLIVHHSPKCCRTCTEILLDEWGTSGRTRPALGHLLYLLEKAQLYRAADFVAINLLNQAPPQRPEKGPSARVRINLNELHHKPNKLEKMLADMDYPSSAIEELAKPSINTNLNYTNKALAKPSINTNKVPKIVVTGEAEAGRGLSDAAYNMPDILPNSSARFSDIPTGGKPSAANFPVMVNESTPSANIPNLSLIKGASSANLPLFSQLLKSEPISTRSCASPLPQLSLNTMLPSFNYAEIEAATDGFDETPVKENGRFLGAGAFGKVYLAHGLIKDAPVAVKKLILDDKVEQVGENDVVTKQFRNEVEILSRYKHENLLGLLGYSCDGCSYCLMYDYMPGGSLKERLQNKENGLFWTERLYIALGTAKGIAYLHTAYTSPLIHRDVKTANILLDANNKPKLGDFGLVKLTPNQNTRTATTVHGTRAYMSQEAFRGDISPKMDTYSFGVVLLELITGLPPHDDTRQGADIVTYMEDNCDENIEKFLDTSAGTWISQNVMFGEEIYQISNRCLIPEKKIRSNMVEVVKSLVGLIEKIS